MSTNAIEKLPYINGLNSTMVRLKLWEDFSNYDESRSRSQFHYGSIKTIKDESILNALPEGLNSTMVRLKLIMTAMVILTR